MAIVADLGSGLAAAGRGATLIQLRAPALSVRALEAAAARLVAESGLPVVVSRRADVAGAAGAAGVHLPEDDLPVAAARHLLGPHALVGSSVHDLQGGLTAAAAGASYVIFGPVFATPSHPRRPGVGVPALAVLAEALPIPVLAVGGISSGNISQVLGAGAAGHAAIRLYR